MLDCGPDAVLIEVHSLAEVAAVRAAVLAAAPGYVVDVVPAARTVLVRCTPGTSLATIRELVAQLRLDTVVAPAGRSVTIPVIYDGPDLELVAATAGLTVKEVIELHTSTTYTVAFCGFAPGFGYLTGLPEPLRQARLDTPRPTVPTGAVGLAGPYTGVYPRSTPGGWRLLGRTPAVLFDSARPQPALLTPGDQVRFEARPC